jgi:eukaryotic-like serine/threonine-protein kinase
MIPSGTKLGRYEIRSKLGAGGMGEVYLAQDTTELDRTVALKILPAEVAANKDRLQRFTQKARTVSNLNHPNILTIYEFGQADSVCFIATEFIEGETLRQHFSGCRLKLVDVLDIAAQIVAALNAAHEAGVVHRDIKPENVMVRRDHIVKVLDFGLAKPTGKSASSSVDSEAGTKVLVHTEPGLVMGTVSYMSPEQSVGSGVDHRTDIWSAGVLLYEMLAGVVPFAGKDIHRQIIAIQEQEPAPLAHHVEGVPARLEEIVVKCLAKDKDERYQTARDLLIDLRNLRRRLDVDAEIERTVAPVFRTTSGGGASRTPTQSFQPDAGATNAVPARMTSSAEYLVAQVQRHKTSALIAVGVLVLAVAAIGYYLHTRNTEIAIESIAVLPFVNQNHDADSEYLSDGVTESIINSLTQLPNLKVIARSSVFRYKGKETDPLAAGKELGVRAVLTGRIMQRGDNLTISAELVDVRDNKQLWGEQYSEKVSDLLSVQREIASKITSNLRLKLSGEQQSRVTKNYTLDPEAYQLYLKGRYQLNKRTEDSLNRGVEFFNQSIEQDPNYALAYAGLADAYNQMGLWTTLPPAESFSKAKAAAERALQLDSTLGEAHTALAFEKFQYEWDFAGAENEYRQGISLNPNFATARELHGYQMYLADPHGFNEAMQELRKAQELDPLSSPVSFNIAVLFYFERRYDEAIEQLKRIHDLDPNFTLANGLLGAAYMGKGMFAEAVAAWLAGSTLEGQGLSPQSINALNEAFKKSGIKAFMQKHAELLEQKSKQRYVSAYFIAMDYAYLGEKDLAFVWLEKAYQERSSWLTCLRVDPLWANLHSDPRFADLLRRIGLPQ